jgi:hypothetical protein
MPYYSGWMGPRTLRDIGMVPDSTSHAVRNKDLLTAALNAGMALDGEMSNYYVSGRVQVTKCNDFRRTKLTQQTPLTGDSNITLSIRDASALVCLTDVEIDHGGDWTGGGTGTEGAIQFFDCVDVRARGLRLSRFGAGNGIWLEGCTGWVDIDTVHVFDFHYERASGQEVSDDAIQGVFLAGGMRAFNLSNVLIDCPNTNVNGAQGVTARYSRGIAFGGPANGTIHKAVVFGTDQGIDITGGAAYGGSKHLTMSDCKVDGAYTWGFKIANTQSRITVSNCIAKECGRAGLVVSAGVSPMQEFDVLISGCQFHDIGNAYWTSQSATIAGIQILAALSPSWPRGVQIIGCKFSERRVAPNNLMAYGITSGKVLEDLDFIVADECTFFGMKIADVSGLNAHFAAIRATGQSLATATQTAITWTTEDADPSGMHAAASADITVKKSGVYEIEGVLQWLANATGQRSVILKINGAALSYSRQNMDATAGSLDTAQVFYYRAPLLAGDVVSIEALQNSGSSVTVQSNSTLTIRLIEAN